MRLRGSFHLIPIVAAVHEGASTTKFTTEVWLAFGYRGTSCHGETRLSLSSSHRRHHHEFSLASPKILLAVLIASVLRPQLCRKLNCDAPNAVHVACLSPGTLLGEATTRPEKVKYGTPNLMVSLFDSRHPRCSRRYVEILYTYPLVAS